MTKYKISEEVTVAQQWRWRPQLSFQTVGLPLVLVALYIVFSITAPNFATLSNQLNILQSAAFVGIIAFGMTLVIISGQIDISVGSAVALSSALLGVLSVNLGIPLYLAVVIVMVEGCVVGLFAGYLVARFGVPSFIVTLALFSALKGMALLITNAYPVSIDNEAFLFWGSGKVVGIPVPALLLLVTFAVFLFISTRTTFGRSTYAVGGNAEAARLSGLPVARIRILGLGITGLLAAIVGILQSSRLASGNPNIGAGLEFDAIAAVIIGGTSLFGGKGSMVGTLLGVLLITVLSNGMVMLGLNPYAQQVVRGVVVVAAVLVGTIQNRKSV